MSEFFFVVKTVLFSVLLMMLLQMQVGSATLERHTENWIYRSRAGDELQTIARGAVRAGYTSWDWIQRQMGSAPSEKNQERSERSRSRDHDLD